jgi:RNA polymerase sigma-70 factor (ECF subfamily)
VSDARAAATLAARASYGRLVAMVARRTRDVAAAEDALGDALARALERWPQTGVPANPEAWLLTVARRAAGHDSRAAAVRGAAEPVLTLLAEERAAAEGDTEDPRLALLFACAHPAIDAAARTPLMLTAVQGLSAAQVAAAYLEKPTALSQRLVRAKARLKLAGVPFTLPERAEWHARLSDVLEAIYAIAALAEGDGELLGEAVYLAGLLADALPREGEALGLLALLLFLAGRRPGGRDAAGAYVPLDRQDCARWDRAAIDRGDAVLRAAAALGRPGRFQIEAAIQSAHCWRRSGRATPWRAILALHDRLRLIAPTIGSEIARASALGELEGAAAALAALAEVPAPAGTLAWEAARAHWLAEAGRTAEARLAYGRAAALAGDPAVADWLRGRRQAPAARA